MELIPALSLHEVSLLVGEGHPIESCNSTLRCSIKDSIMRSSLRFQVQCLLSLSLSLSPRLDACNPSIVPLTVPSIIRSFAHSPNHSRTRSSSAPSISKKNRLPKEESPALETSESISLKLTRTSMTAPTLSTLPRADIYQAKAGFYKISRNLAF